MKKFHLFVLALLQSCVYKHIDVAPICIAETNNLITYEKNIKPILEKNCISCHNVNYHLDEVQLDSHNEMVYWSNHNLLDQIIPFGGNIPRMPKGGKLTDCEISTIKKWIESGLK